MPEDWYGEAIENLEAQIGRVASPEDFIGWVATKGSRGAHQGLLLRYCMIAVNNLHLDADRWARLESPGQPTSAIWLKRSEAERIVKAMRSDHSPEGRLVRQSIRDRFPT